MHANDLLETLHMFEFFTLPVTLVAADDDLWTEQASSENFLSLLLATNLTLKQVKDKVKVMAWHEIH